MAIKKRLTTHNTDQIRVHMPNGQVQVVSRARLKKLADKVTGVIEAEHATDAEAFVLYGEIAKIFKSMGGIL